MRILTFSFGFWDQIRPAMAAFERSCDMDKDWNPPRESIAQLNKILEECYAEARAAKSEKGEDNSRGGGGKAVEGKEGEEPELKKQKK